MNISFYFQFTFSLLKTINLHKYAKQMKKQKNKKNRKPNNYTADQRENARKLYLRGLYLLEISILLNIPKRTLENWQSSEKWTILKECPEVKKRAYDLKAGGYKNEQIAEMLHVSTVTVWRYIKAYEKERDRKE